MYMCVCPHTPSAFEPVGRLGCAERSFFLPSSQCPLFICRNAFGGLEAVAVEEGLGDEGERLLYMFAHTPVYVSSYSYICVLMVLYTCPHVTIYVSPNSYVCLMLLYVSSCYCVCVLIPPCVLILLHRCSLTTVCPHTTACVLILLTPAMHTTYADVC